MYDARDDETPEHDTWYRDVSPAQAKIRRKAETFRLMKIVAEEIWASLAGYAKTLKWEDRPKRTKGDS